MVLSQATISLEPVSLEHRNRCVIKKRAGHRPSVRVLRVALHDSTPASGDFFQRSFKSDRRDTFASILSVYEETRDSPLWKFSETLLIVSLVLDPRKFVSRPVLTPSDCDRTIVDESSVCSAFSDSMLFFMSVF